MGINEPKVSGYREHVREGVLTWLEAVRYKEEGWGRWAHNCGAIRPFDLRASGFAVQILNSFGMIEQVGIKEKEEALHYFSSCQHPDGYNKDPQISEKDLSLGHPFTWDHIWAQWGGMVRPNLKILGGEPLYPPPLTVGVNYINDDVSTWISQLDWKNPWLQGELFSRSIGAYMTGRTRPLPFVDHPRIAAVFAFMEKEILNPESGLPDLGGCHEPDIAMAGLFKIMAGYQTVGRQIPYSRPAIDSVLALQTDDGDYAVCLELPVPDGQHYVLRHRREMCVNWDAIYVLRELDMQVKSTYRHKDIVDSARRHADCLMKSYRKPDGGFAFARDHCMTVDCGVKVSAPLPEGDILGTFMCLASFDYIDEWAAGSHVKLF